jgi:hypothetical protein
MTHSIFNNNWGKVALGSSPKIKCTLQSHVTKKKKKRRRRRKESNINWYIHALTIRKGRGTWTTSETLLVARSFIRDSKEDTYSAFITKFTMKMVNKKHILSTTV